MSVEVYSDFVCPWCYIGHRRLERALAALPSDRRPKIAWSSHQLDPRAGGAPGRTAAEAMRGWYRRPDEAEARIARITAIGREEGLRLDLERACPVGTFDAHRLSHFAMGLGLREALHEQLFRAYHTDGRNIADPDVLVASAGEAGIDRSEARALLASDRFGDAVRADARRGSRQGVRGVPTIVVDDGRLSSAVQEHSALIELLNTAGE